jgi:hypothetical protein
MQKINDEDITKNKTAKKSFLFDNCGKLSLEERKFIRIGT